MLSIMSNQEIQAELGTFIKALRLQENKCTQQEKSQQCDIPLGTYKRLENKGEGSIKDLIKILAAYNMLNRLEEIMLIPKSTPIEELEGKKTSKRMRVRSKTSKSSHT